MNSKTIYDSIIKKENELPKDAVEHAKADITRKGYDTTGYGYQFLVNVLNEVCGIDGWNYTYKVIKESEGKWSNGKSYWEICVETPVEITVEEKKVTKTMVGGHKSEMYADALKGAITNSLKKTFAMFGLGHKAYEGTIDDDYLPIATDDSPQPTPTYEPIVQFTPKKGVEIGVPRQCRCGNTYTPKYANSFSCQACYLIWKANQTPKVSKEEAVDTASKEAFTELIGTPPAPYDGLTDKTVYDEKTPF